MQFPTRLNSPYISLIGKKVKTVSRLHLDGVKVGIILPNGPNLIVFAHCLAGKIEVYDSLLTILNSMPDASLVEEWLTDIWLSSVC